MWRRLDRFIAGLVAAIVVVATLAVGSLDGFDAETAARGYEQPV